MDDLRGRRVLVVDDDRLVGLAIEEMTVDQGCRVAGAAGGDAALALLQTEAFDVLVSDIRMPGMNGFDLARRAQAMQAVLAVVLCTGDASAWSAELRSATWPVLHKPFTEAQLASALRAALRGRVAPTAADLAACG